GRVVNGIGTIFINRKNARDLTRVSALIQSAIQGGQGVFLFPEGTSTRGAEVLPFKPGLLDVAAQAEMPVHYAALSYRTLPNESPAELSVCWWGEMTFLPHLWALFQLSQIDCQITFGAEPIIEQNRKTLAERLHAAVQENFKPTSRPMTVTEEMHKAWKISCQLDH
ncbi:MAG TPA: lysophospholipid acyltransferase family protein, partial [Blastocatellia bacterium]|nr:lysophospholipid acyltransferase family protein [Blastocatellia bacterium]